MEMKKKLDNMVSDIKDSRKINNKKVIKLPN